MKKNKVVFIASTNEMSNEELKKFLLNKVKKEYEKNYGKISTNKVQHTNKTME